MIVSVNYTLANNGVNKVYEGNFNVGTATTKEYLSKSTQEPKILSTKAVPFEFIEYVFHHFSKFLSIFDIGGGKGDFWLIPYGVLGTIYTKVVGS